MKEQEIFADSLEDGMLDKLRGVKDNPKQKERSKDRNQYDEMQISAHGLKTQFTLQLEKLGQADTREQAMKHIQKLINDYSTSETLRIYLSILKGLKRSVANSSTKEHQVLVIAYICQKYKTNLIDPIDKPPSLLKTAFRVVELIHSYFTDPAMTVQEACARALIDLYSYCLRNEPIQSKLSLVFLPLASLLTTGQDRMAQLASSVCISQLVNYWYSKGELDIIRRIDKQLLFVFLKVNAEFYIIMDAIAICLKVIGLAFLEGKFPSFVNKLLVFLSQQDKKSTGKAATPLNSYMSKVEACKMLDTVAKMIVGKQQFTSQIKPLEILAELDRASKNKLIQVQKAAHQALKSWRQVAGLENAQEDKQKQLARPESSNKLSNLNEMRQKFKKQKSKSREHSEETSKTRQKIQQQLKFMKEDLGQLVKGKGWGPQNRGQNFIKKGTGIGGGQVGNMDTSPGTKNRKTHDEHIKQLRKFVQSEKEARKIAPEAFPNWGKIRGAEPRTSKSPKHDRSKSPKKVFDSKIDISEHVRIYPDLSNAHRPASAQDRPKLHIPSKPPISPLYRRDDHQFEVIEDHGDQAAIAVISFGGSQDASAPSTGHRNNLKDTFISRDNSNHRYPPKDNSHRKGSYEEPVEYLALADMKQQQSKHMPIELDEFKDLLSKQEMQEFIDAGSLSGVSSYLGGIINEDDIDEEKVQRMNSQILEKQVDYLCVRQMKSNRKESSLRETASKFMKRVEFASSGVIKGNESLQYTQSKQKDRLEESIKLELSKLAEKRKQGDRLSQAQREPSPQDIPQQDIPSRIPSKAFRKSLYDFPSSRQPVIELPSQQKRQKNEDSQQEVNSEFEQSNQLQRPIPQVNVAPKPLPQMLKPIKSPETQYEEMKGKNYQNLIAKPPPKTASAIIQNREKNEGLQRQSKTGASFRPKQLQQPIESDATDSGLLEKWKAILSAVDKQQINEAFELAFELDDSVYLLRLVLLTGSCFDKLTVENSKKLWNMFNETYNSRYFDILVLSMFTQANELGVIDKTLNLEDNNFLLSSLYEMSGQLTGRVSYRSAVLYNEIESKLKN